MVNIYRIWEQKKLLQFMILFDPVRRQNAFTVPFQDPPFFPSLSLLLPSLFPLIAGYQAAEISLLCFQIYFPLADIFFSALFFFFFSSLFFFFLLFLFSFFSSFHFFLFSSLFYFLLLFIFHLHFFSFPLIAWYQAAEIPFSSPVFPNILPIR